MRRAFLLLLLSGLLTLAAAGASHASSYYRYCGYTYGNFKAARTWVHQVSCRDGRPVVRRFVYKGCSGAPNSTCYVYGYRCHTGGSPGYVTTCVRGIQALVLFPGVR